jgi:hypothetical protein
MARLVPAIHVFANIKQDLDAWHKGGHDAPMNSANSAAGEGTMGITPLHAQLLILEHKYKPLPETVHLLGRQTVILNLDDAIALMRRLGVEPREAATEIDHQTVGAQQQAGHQFISDRTFFGLLGVRNVPAIDHSDYEGAEIIADLNRPLPPDLCESVNFLVGGSVLDNVFDPVTYIRNVASLVKPGGRLFEQNILSQNYHPYSIVSPQWVLDYFVVNRFRDCLIYVTEEPAGSAFVHMYGVEATGDDMVSDFGPPRGQLSLGIIVIAEKGEQSTWDGTPIQDQYRGEPDAAAYRDKLNAMQGGRSLPQFEVPTPLELSRLGIRGSKSYKYLGVVRSPHREQDVPARDDGGVRILQATYGGNCLNAPLAKSAVCSVYRGNVTELLASMLNGVESCRWMVDVNILGDPAPQRGKDLEVFYVVGAEPNPRLRRAYIPAEASGKILQLPHECVAR